MEKFVIEGGSPLSGEVAVSGAKNAALPLLFATVLSDRECIIENVPCLADIETTFKMLGHLGVRANWDRTTGRAAVQADKVEALEAPYELVRTMRASVLVLGPLLARFGKARVSLPGGCSIGARPVDLHLMAMEQMGATISIEEGYIVASAPKLKGAVIRFPTVSVGATENTLMAAALADGETTIENAAQEPEIVDLCRLLKGMGVTISGEGTPTIRVRGATALKPVKHRIIADRIEAGTYISAVGIAGGKVTMPHVSPGIFAAVLEKFSAMGISITPQGDGLLIEHAAGAALKGVDVTTKEFPGFPTDMQAQLMAAACFAQGPSNINETIFENRFMHVPELTRLGADIKIQGNTALVRGKGPGSLSGATVMATDLRASASLVLAGLGAKGQTTVRRIYHLDRGYERMEEKLSRLGAKVLRQPD